MAETLDGDALVRGDPGYEQARHAAVWNARTPERYPDVIVRAASEEDAVRAIGIARADRLRLSVCSGGHSWSGSHLRDGGLLLDLSALNQATVDHEAMTASAGPGVKGTELNELVREHGLFFPVGHCTGVAIGGYLLQGGFGWNSRVHGPACESITGIDAVTAAGERVHASESENEDLLWAARGAGPGFFAAATRFHLGLYERPPVTMVSNYVFRLDVLRELFTWAREVGPEVARCIEMMLFFLHDPEGSGETRILLNGPAIAGSEEEAREALSILETCPVLDRAVMSVTNQPAHVGDLTAASLLMYPHEHRYAVDNIWTSAPIDELLPGLERIAETLPGAPSHSHMLWMNWGPSPERTDMAYSVEDEIYIALYAVWADAADDERFASWPGDRMREMEHVSSGIQLADENLAERPDRFLTDPNRARLDELRAKWDPDGMFWPEMGAD